MKNTFILILFFIVFCVFGYSTKSFFDYAEKSNSKVYREKVESKNDFYKIPTERSLK